MPFITKQLNAPIRQKTLLFLMDALKITRSEAQRLLSKGRLTQNGIPITDQFGFIEGDFEIIIFEPISLGITPAYVTNDFVVYDKPSGLGVHPHSRQAPHTLNDEIKHQFGSDANATHRIDQETSGLVLVSLNKKSEPVLKQLFAERFITKRYLAMVRGYIDSPLDINEPILRLDNPDLFVSMVVKIDPAGKHARTLVTPLHYFPEHNMTLVEASPLTGRTHQIRVHLFHVKHPIVGDPLYGQDEADIIRFIGKKLTPDERLSKSGAVRLLLHAHSLEFEYEGKPYHIVSQEDFVKRCFEAMKIDLERLDGSSDFASQEEAMD